VAVEGMAQSGVRYGWGRITEAAKKQRGKKVNRGGKGGLRNLPLAVSQSRAFTESTA